MKRTIELDPARLQERHEAHAYLQEVFQFDDSYGHNLDALKDSLSEVRDDCDLVFTHDAIEQILAEPYAYRILTVLGSAACENPHLHILFR